MFAISHSAFDVHAVRQAYQLAVTRVTLLSDME